MAENMFNRFTVFFAGGVAFLGWDNLSAGPAQDRRSESGQRDTYRN